MFPSQRGNFFPNVTSSNVNSVDDGYKSKSRGSPRLTSPPLGVSAGTGSPQNFSAHKRDSKTVIPGFETTKLRKPDLASKYRASLAARSKGAESLDEEDTQQSQLVSSSPNHIHMSRVPSSWSNRRWSTEPYYARLQRINNIGSISSNSKVVCDAQDSKCDKLRTKTQQERLLIKKLCEDALKNRRDVFAFYSKVFEDDIAETDARLSNFDPQNHKGRLSDFMLKLVTQRQELLNKRRDVQNLPNSVLKDTEEERPRYTPVYCVDGKTLLGKPYDSISFPNTFAPLSELQDPEGDPKGFRRFNTLVNMKEFRDNEIFFRATDNCLTVDGVRWKKDDSDQQRPYCGARVMSIYVDLPNGVYPEHLRIGRSTDGILVLQEAWKF